MTPFFHRPAHWNRDAAAAWGEGRRDAALGMSLASLGAMAAPDADAFLQTAYYLFELGRYSEAAEVLSRGRAQHPGHPAIVLSLGTSLTRAGKPREAIEPLEAFVAAGHADMSGYDALARAHGEVGDLERAAQFGTLALAMKDEATRARHDTPALRRDIDPVGKRRVIAFTLFGSGQRYLRGAIDNLLAARRHYPGWTCRFTVDDSVDAALMTVLAEEGAELVHDDSGERDMRHLLSRRFLVNDDPEVGHFLVRDADSVINSREAAAVDQWLASDLPFHAMRDWHTHSDPLMAGMWGGVAGVFPRMRAALDVFRARMPMQTNWDQLFLRDQLWPAIRNDCVVHDRLFDSHAARPFPTLNPASGHVGQDEFASDLVRQEARLAAFARRVPALGIGSAQNEKDRDGAILS